ncbi:unnamed protein product [Rotaria sp. Silwood1]|nr:unnamed protein product [Rotaria sp. Silwood1]
MANNVVVETHYTQNMNRSLAADSETYQQCNYQTFQMLVLSVVDPLNTDEVRLKHLHNIAENIEILSTLPNYAVYIDLLVKNLLRSLIETDTVFIIPSNAQTIRKQMIEIFHRLPITEALRGFVKDILSPMFKLLTKENEENALLLLRIIVEYMKQFRPQMIMEVREFLQFVHNVYRQKASALDQIFLTKTFSHPTITINEIDLSTIIEQICTSVKLIVKKIQNFPVQSSITTDEATNSTPHIVTDTFTILSRASHSVKLLAEFPVAIVLLYQLCRQSLQAEFGELVPLFLRYLTLQPSKEQKNDPKFNMEIYIEFLTTQAKTLSFLAFVGKTYQEQLALNSDLLVLAIFQLLDGCPPENVQLRKDIIVAARHFVSSDFRTLFIPHVKRFFDENLLLSTGPLSSDTYDTNDTIDCSVILIDSIVFCYIDIDDELNSIGRISFETLFNTLLIIFNNDYQRITQLPLINYLIHTLCNHCYDRMWYSKQGSCRFLHQLCLHYFRQETNWFLENLNQILNGFFHVIISLNDEISSGTLDIISNMIKEFLEYYAQIKSNENLNENLIELLLNYLFSPISYVRNLIYDCLRQLSFLFQQTILRLIEPFRNDLIKKFSSSNILPFKNQSLMYQITYLDIYIYFRTLEPKITYITLYDDDLFKELTTFLFDENDLIKSSSYRSLTQQQLTLNIILLKKLSIRTLGEYYEQIEYRDRVLRLFYKILTTIPSNELQLIVYESIEKIFNGHQNEQLRLRFVDLYIQKIPFHDYEKLNLTPQIAQTLFYLSKLSPNSFDERLCEQILNLIRRLMQNIAQTFRSIIDTQNQFYKTCLILLDLLAILPSSSKKIIESLTILILKFDKHLMIESSSACRKYLIELLVRHPQLSLDQFINDENRLQDLQWSRLFLDLLKSSSSSNIQTFVRTNWLDRFRQILSDHIVFIETTQNIPSIICITIRSLSILARTDQLWWSRQHELVSLLLRLWRSNTFQQHSFLSSEHFDSFCTKELNNVLNLCLIYYQYQPERIRLLLELTRIYTCIEKLFYPKKFFHFIQDIIIKTYSLKWKRDALLSFISLRNDESYTLECKSLFFEYILLPSFTYEFENNKIQINNELFQINSNSDETIIDLFIRTMIDKKYLHQINDKYRICLLRFLCLFLEYKPQLICDTNSSLTNKRDNEKLRRVMECAYETLSMNNIDSTFKCQAHLLLCYIISKYPIVKRIITNVFTSLLKSYIIDAKYLIRQATDLLIPAIPIRMDDGYDVLAEYTKKILSDDAHGNLQLMHIMTIIVRHQTIYFHVRYILANLMIQSAQKIASQQSNSMEHKKLAIDIIEVIIKWELRKHHEQTNDQKNFNRALIDTIFNFLIRHACQINLQNMLPLSQQCIRLFKIARKFAWPNVDVKLTTFERLIHQIESPNITAHNSIAIAIDLLAFLISTFTVIQIKYTMRTLKRSLITCVSITNYPRLVESMQNLFSKLIIQIPIEPPAAIIPTTATNTQQGLSPQLVQATLASLATATTNNQQSILTNNVPISTHTISKSEDIEQFYTIITKTIIDNMNSTPTSIVNTTDR